MEKKTTITKVLFFIGIFLLLANTKSIGQTIRYQQSIRGGFTKASNSLVNVPSASYGGYGQAIINTAGGTSMSSSADVVLPVGSTIIKAFLYVEGYTSNGIAISSAKFKVPGGAYVTLNSGSAGFIGNPITSLNEAQFIVDVTAMIPSPGFVSNYVAGGDPSMTGRYAVADIGGYDASNYGYGWTLIVVYTNPSARYRNVSVVDNNAVYGGTGCLGASCYITFNVSGIAVPSAGPFNAIIGFTSTWGDIGLGDNVQFCKQGGSFTSLTDPTTGGTSDLCNSTIGICANNNVSVDAAAAGAPIAMSGNFIARNPYNTFTNSNTGATNWYSYFYDSDIVDASGILPNSATPINVSFKEISPAGLSGGDVLGGGAYVISVDITSALVTKSLSPSTIITGGTATYTWTIDNSLAGSLSLSGIGFTDNLPSNIVVASPPNASITGGTGGTITAVAGASSVNVSSLSLSSGQIATMKVNVTNKAGALNASCAANPLAFTNGFSNISGQTANLANGVTNQCLVVTAVLPVAWLSFNAHLNKGGMDITWATASEQNNDHFEVQRSTDGVNYMTIGTIKGAGTSNLVRNYGFRDLSPLGGNNYYRLKQVDYNGSESFSPIVTVDINKFISNITISPQPVGSNAQIALYSNQECIAHLNIYDIAGRKIIQLEDRHFAEGNNTLDLDLSNLSTGNYFLVISNNDGLRENIKLVK